MSRYTVVAKFKDLKDENHVYEVGDAYPRKGKPTKRRTEELSSVYNKQNQAFIEEVEPEQDVNPDDDDKG